MVHLTASDEAQGTEWKYHNIRKYGDTVVWLHCLDRGWRRSEGRGNADGKYRRTGGHQERHHESRKEFVLRLVSNWGRRCGTVDRTAKKHLMAIPVQSYTGDDTFARVYAEKDILMLHLWNDGKFKGRHLVDKTGKYVAEIDGVMHIKRLRNQICDSSSHMYGWPDMRVSEEDEKTVHAFFEEYNDIGLLINQAESQYSKDQYSRKMDRKIDRINAKMALFEEQEEKIKEWYLREITPWEYAFKADGVYYCTACGETLEWLQWKAKHPKAELKTETLKELERKRITPGRLGVMINLMSPRKCLNFLDRQEKLMNDTISPVITYYEDYISIARKIGMDIRDEIVYAPKDLKLRHDQLVDEFNRRKSEFEAQEMDEKWPGAQEVLNRIRDIYDYQGDGWQIITPRTLMYIVDDSHQLHHCAGASDRYYERIQSEETYILFLRRDPKKAWYTLEVEPGGTVRQKRSEYNRQPDLDTVNKYLKEWQEEIKKRLKERDKQLAAQSAQQRAEEMEQLKNGTERNRQLFDLLMNDLMEVGA